MKIKLFKNNTQRDPDHEFDAPPDFDPRQIVRVAQTGCCYVLGYKIAGEDSYAFMEAEIVDVNFAVGFGPGRRDA